METGSSSTLPGPTAADGQTLDVLANDACIRNDAVDWVAALLGATRGEPSRRRLLSATPPQSRPYAMLPSARRPRFVLPLTDRRAAASVMAHSGVGSGRVDGAARQVLAAGLRAGLLQPLLRGRLYFEAGDGPLPTVGCGSLLGYLREVLDQPVGFLGVRLGSVRGNARPIITLLADDGRIIGRAKVGWNALTRHLVRAEAETLTALGPTRSTSVDVPRLLHRGRWRGLEVLVQSHLELAGRREVDAACYARASAEIGQALGSERGRLRDSSYLRDLWRRVLGASPLQSRSRLSRLLQAFVATHGSRTLAFGLWHGDFSPCNTAVVAGRVCAWNWERARRGVPLGLDAVHYHFRAGRSGERRALGDAAAEAGHRAVPWLEAAGISPVNSAALVHLLLLELVTRHYLDGPGVATPAATALCASALDHLECELGRRP